MLSKKPVDLFSHFSKRPDIQFSIFQYPRFFYAEQRIQLQKNKALIEEQLASLNAGGKLLAVLDDDDILNVEETIRREKAGLTLSLIVAHVGQAEDEIVR